MAYITRYLSEVFTAYCLVFIIASSSILAGFRRWLIARTPKLKIQDYPHFIECRMCVGFYVSIIVCLLYGEIKDVLVVYGASYFLATQERR